MSVGSRARRFIARKGTVLPLTKPAVVTRNPVTQTSTTTPAVTQSVVVTILPVTTADDMAFDQRVMAMNNRRTLLISGRKADGSLLDFYPAPEQTIVFEGATWKLDGVDRVAMSDGVPEMFSAQAKR